MFPWMTFHNNILQPNNKTYVYIQLLVYIVKRHYNLRKAHGSEMKASYGQVSKCRTEQLEITAKD